MSVRPVVVGTMVTVGTPVELVGLVGAVATVLVEAEETSAGSASRVGSAEPQATTSRTDVAIANPARNECASAPIRRMSRITTPGWHAAVPMGRRPDIAGAYDLPA